MFNEAYHQTRPDSLSNRNLRSLKSSYEPLPSTFPGFLVMPSTIASLPACTEVILWWFHTLNSYPCSHLVSWFNSVVSLVHLILLVWLLSSRSETIKMEMILWLNITTICTSTCRSAPMTSCPLSDVRVWPSTSFSVLLLSPKCSFLSFMDFWPHDRSAPRQGSQCWVLSNDALPSGLHLNHELDLLNCYGMNVNAKRPSLENKSKHAILIPRL